MNNSAVFAFQKFIGSSTLVATKNLPSYCSFTRLAMRHRSIPSMRIANFKSYVTVTKYSNKNNMRSSSPVIQSKETTILDELLQYTDSLVDHSSVNLIAFSGGVDSSLTAFLVNRVFKQQTVKASLHCENKNSGYVKAVIGVSPSLPPHQLDLARSIAHEIGINLTEVKTREGFDENYVKNKGQACFVCKSHLYSSLKAVASVAASESNTTENSSMNKQDVILYNGTNADDTKDPTRIGILAANSFFVKSPLLYSTKEEVRRYAKHLGLSNWNFAASPCLRSRLALGVKATSRHLRAVNRAENMVRRVLNLDETINMRVRLLAKRRVMVEIDNEWLLNKDVSGDALNILKGHGMGDLCQELGFDSGFGIRVFKSGSVSKTLEKMHHEIEKE